jgi:hypothetical protein
LAIGQLSLGLFSFGVSALDLAVFKSSDAGSPLAIEKWLIA